MKVKDLEKTPESMIRNILMENKDEVFFSNEVYEKLEIDISESGVRYHLRKLTESDNIESIPYKNQKLYGHRKAIEKAKKVIGVD